MNHHITMVECLLESWDVVFIFCPSPDFKRPGQSWAYMVMQAKSRLSLRLAHFRIHFSPFKTHLTVIRNVEAEIGLIFLVALSFVVSSQTQKQSTYRPWQADWMKCGKSFCNSWSRCAVHSCKENFRFFISTFLNSIYWNELVQV